MRLQVGDCQRLYETIYWTLPGDCRTLYKMELYLNDCLRHLETVDDKKKNCYRILINKLYGTVENKGTVDDW